MSVDRLVPEVVEGRERGSPPVTVETLMVDQSTTVHHHYPAPGRERGVVAGPQVARVLPSKFTGTLPVRRRFVGWMVGAMIVAPLLVVAVGSVSGSPYAVTVAATVGVLVACLGGVFAELFQATRRNKVWIVVALSV